MRQSRLASRLNILVAIFGALFLIFGFVVWRTLEQVRINGALYDKIIESKDLIADVLPPPAYIIESYLTTLQMSEETDPARINELIEYGNARSAEYETRQEYWKPRLAGTGELGDQMTSIASRHATEFYRLRDEVFIPAVQAGNREAVQAALAQMQRAYDQHRRAIDRVVTISNANWIALEAEAQDTVTTQMQALLILGMSILVVVMIMAWMAHRIAKTLSGRIHLATDIAGRVAEFDARRAFPRPEP